MARKKIDQGSGWGGARPGSGRPAVDNPMVPVTIMEQEFVIDALDKLAQRNGTTRAAEARRAIRRYLRQVKVFSQKEVKML